MCRTVAASIGTVINVPIAADWDWGEAFTGYLCTMLRVDQDSLRAAAGLEVCTWATWYEKLDLDCACS